MHFLQESKVHCPYCNEAITLLINQEDMGSEYIEDCSVCCRPIYICLSVDNNQNMLITIKDENEI